MPTTGEYKTVLSRILTNDAGAFLWMVVTFDKT